MKHAPRHVVITLVVAGMLAWLASPGYAQFVPYDAFAGGFIDPASWQAFSNEGTLVGPTAEAFRTVENGSLRLSLVSWGNDTSDAGSVRSRQGVNMTQLGTPGGSGFITGVKAKVTVQNADAQDCPGNPETAAPSLTRAQVIGAFFNDGSGSAGNRTGDILAILELQKRKDGSDRIHASVNRCPDSACSSSVPVAVAGNGATFDTLWSPNNALNLKIVWNQGGGKFAFSVSDPLTLATETIPIIYQGTVALGGPPIIDFKSVRLLNDVENCSGDRKSTTMDALFDNITVRRAP
jgi:hypothetical protein